MDAIIKKFQRETTDSKVKRPSQEEAEAAVRVLLAWAGDDPAREGLLDTPAPRDQGVQRIFQRL